MSENRFKKMDTIIDPFPIWDTVEEKGYNCTDTLDLLVCLLNEQHDELQLLRATNREQYEQIQRFQEEEKLYAKEILRLNELNKQTSEYKDILGDY